MQGLEVEGLNFFGRRTLREHHPVQPRLIEGLEPALGQLKVGMARRELIEYLPCLVISMGHEELACPLQSQPAVDSLRTRKGAQENVDGSLNLFAGLFHLYREPKYTLTGGLR